MKAWWTSTVLAASLFWITHAAAANDVVISIEKPMDPPYWALLQRQLLDAQADACREFFNKYFDERGYLLCVERWGGDDGPDDAIENCNDWPLLYALGGHEDILRMVKKAWEGHLRQFTEAKTTHVPFAKDGMYYKEFPVMFDWMHHGEGLTVFNLLGLCDPRDPALLRRTRRYAGFYMNEDPQAPNYDPEHKVIRSLFNGSRGPLLRKSTALDWAGDPIEVEHRFQLGHGERSYEEMLAHFEYYNDIVGDHPQNLSATALALNAYLLTHEEKYKRWLLEYVDAWHERTLANGGIIPSNIGLDGTIGGECDGKWYGGVYGWAFSVVVPQTGEVAHRNRHHRALIGFGSAYLLTGDERYVNVWGEMIDKINAEAKFVDGVKQFPHMYGDGGWYAYTPEPYREGATQVYYWSMNPRHKNRVANRGWIEYLSGTNPEYPERSFLNDLASVRRKVQRMRQDQTTPDTRLSDDPMKYNPATVESLVELMMGGFHPDHIGAPLHCRVRYFDPVGRRAGVPDDVAVLVHKVSADETAMTLVNLNQSQPRKVVLQGGAYAEHQWISARIEGQEIAIDRGHFTVRLAPGSGADLVLANKRYVNDPTLIFPWDRVSKEHRID